MSRRSFWSVPAILYVVAIFLAACTPSNQPQVLLSSPPYGSKFSEGQVIAIRSVSTDPSGIIRVELFIDGFMVHADAVPKPQPEFSITQNWRATSGSHIISVRAFNTVGVASDPASLRIAVVPVLAPLDIPSLEPGSPAPTPLAVPTAGATLVTPLATPASGSNNAGAAPASGGGGLAP